MTSLLCVKHLGGNVQVHKPKEAVPVEEDDSYKHFIIRSKKSKSHPGSSKYSLSEATKSPSSNSFRVQDWLSEKSIKDLQERSDDESKSAKKLYNPILETEKTFVQDLDNYVQYEDLLALRKKELLHKRWTDKVYEPLRREIIKVMDSCRWQDVDRRKRILHKQFLEFVNEKGHIFLETLNPQEYYAQSLNGYRPAPIKVEVNRLQDPLISQSRERYQEDRTILQCLTGERFTDEDIEQVRMPLEPLVPLGRKDGNSQSWLSMPLCDIESPARRASRQRMRGIQSKSNIDLESWSKTPTDAEIINKEWQIQKKRMYSITPPFNAPPVKTADKLLA